MQAGAALSYTDNGDGTITDNNTALMWEKKGDNGGLHDWDNNIYRWSGDGSQETIWDWLDDVNAEGGPGFAGYSDWRIPNLKELQSIVDYEQYSPAVDPVFDTGCAPACTVLNCSCTRSYFYWSATTYQNVPSDAWGVNFFDGIVYAVNKGIDTWVRAVRGGS